MFVQLASLVFSSIFNVFREPFVKLIVRVEETRHDEVQEGPELYHHAIVFSAQNVRVLLRADLAWNFESVCQ